MKFVSDQEIEVTQATKLIAELKKTGKLTLPAKIGNGLRDVIITEVLQAHIKKDISDDNYQAVFNQLEQEEKDIITRWREKRKI